jgi:hypothetical protein
MNLSVLGETYALVEKGRLASQQAARDLGERLAQADVRQSCNGMPPLVMGEAGQASPREALGRIVMGRPRSEGGGPVSPLEAWMQAEVIAAAVASAQEAVTNDAIEVSPEQEARLRDAITNFALSQC